MMTRMIIMMMMMIMMIIMAMIMMMMMMADRPADCVFETDPGGHRMTLHLKTDQAA